MLLKVDDDTVKFISGWILPLAMKLAHSQADTGSSTDTVPSESPIALAAFHFVASPTPDIRDKVYWKPTSSRWSVRASKQQGTYNPAELAVDPCLDSDQYTTAKGATYLRAIAIWNRLDGSRRHRIPVPPM